MISFTVPYIIFFEAAAEICLTKQLYAEQGSLCLFTLPFVCVLRFPILLKLDF